MVNLNRNNSFINRTQLPLLCENFGAILVVLEGLTVDRQAGTKYWEIKFFTDYTVWILTM